MTPFPRVAAALAATLFPAAVAWTTLQRPGPLPDDDDDDDEDDERPIGDPDEEDEGEDEDEDDDEETWQVTPSARSDPKQIPRGRSGRHAVFVGQLRRRPNR